MSIFSKIKGVLPGSSRSLHSFQEDVDRRLDSIYARLEQTDNGINSNINYKFDCRLFPEIDLIKDRQQSLSEQSRIRFEMVMSRAYPSLSPFDLRCKIFELLPPAEGDIRLMQRANAVLMSKLDAICSDNNLPYWLSYGSLIGSLSRSGFIPWDDDIDICMMRSDVLKLIELLKSNPNYQVTVVFDWFVKCRQVRFCSRDAHIPCFIDIMIYDWASDCSQKSNDRLRKLRLEFVNYLNDHENEFSFWKDNPWLFHYKSGYSIQCGDVDFVSQRKAVAPEQIDFVDQAFSKFNAKAFELGLLTDSPDCNVAFALDNIFDVPKRRMVWEHDRIFPTVRHPFESYSFYLPNDASGVADDCYPGWPYMPLDICGHDHFAKDILANSDVRSALIEFINE